MKPEIWIFNGPVAVASLPEYKDLPEFIRHNVSFTGDDGSGFLCYANIKIDGFECYLNPGEAIIQYDGQLFHGKLKILGNSSYPIGEHDSNEPCFVQ